MMNGTPNSLFDEDFAVVTFTARNSGERLSLPADYIRKEAVVYLMIDISDTRWRKLTKGIPVNLFLGDTQYSGWAEDLTGYDEFMQVLSANPDKRGVLIKKYSLPDEDGKIADSEQFHAFLNEYKLIRVKISR
jgi:hypothetical protein